MLSPDGPRSFLATLAVHCGKTWLSLGASSFPGELSIATLGNVYRFKNGVFLGRAGKTSRSFDWPKELRGARLIGFLTEEGGLWSLSPRWTEGAYAVLWSPDATDGEPFIVTSPTTSFTLEEAAELPTPRAEIEAAPESGIRPRRSAPPPTFRRPAPGSTTRIHSALPFADLR